MMMLTITRRQAEILKLKAKGLEDKQVANEVKCSLAMVKKHNRGIFKRLRAYNMTHAVAIAKDRGII